MAIAASVAKVPGVRGQNGETQHLSKLTSAAEAARSDSDSPKFNAAPNTVNFNNVPSQFEGAELRREWSGRNQYPQQSGKNSGDARNPRNALDHESLHDIEDASLGHPLDDTGSVLASAEIGNEQSQNPHDLHSYGQDLAEAPEKRSISWPPLPRSQALHPLRKRIESFQRRTERLEYARERVFLIRMEIKFLRNNYRQQHKFVDESQRMLNDHIERMMKDDDFVTTRDEYLLCYGRARDDYFRLEEQSSNLQTLENHLNTLETSIKRHETQLKITSDRILSLLRHQDPATRDEGEYRDVRGALEAPTELFSSDASEDHASSTSSHENPLLDDYFDKAGNVQVARERLLELYKEHNEKRVIRNLQQDQGVELPVPDAVFELNCDSELKGAQQTVQDAILWKQKAKQACRENGIDPDQHRHASEETDDDGDEHTGSDDPPQIRLQLNHADKITPYTVRTTTGPFGETVVVDEDLPDLPPVSDTVERWIESMDQAQTDPMLNQMTSEEMTPHRETSPSRIALLTQELEPYFARREDAETIAQLVVRSLDFSHWTKQDVDQLASSTGYSTLMNHTRSSSESRLTAVMKGGKPASHINHLRAELRQYLLRHGSADMIARLADLGIELPPTTKENINLMVTQARSNWSDHSRSSSESRISVLLRSEVPRSDAVARLAEIPRGRRR